MSVADRNEGTPLVSIHSIPHIAPDRRTSKEKQRAVNFILASTLFERIAFYAFINTLFTTLQKDDPFHWNTQHSKTASHIFEGISYTSTLLFAIISDWKLGPANTIIIGFVLYLLGLTMMTITASGSTFFCQNNGTDHEQYDRNATSIGQEKCASTIITALVVTALGAGAVKSNLVVLGADQIQDADSKLSSRYFDKYAVVINVGIMIAIMITPYVHNLLHYHNYYILYLVTVSAILIAAILFFIGWRYYFHVNLHETVTFYCLPVMINGCKTWCAYERNRELRDRRRQSSANGADVVMVRVNGPSGSPEIEESMTIRGRLPSVLDFARVPYQGRFLDRHVDDVKSLRLALVVFAMLIPFWLVYDQVGATFQSQAEQMRGPPVAYIGSWISVGDPVVVIIGILILNVCVYKYLENQNRSLSIATKFLLGMCFALASMCVAGIVEILRQKQCTSGLETSQLSVYTQLPQYMLIGFSQLFGMVASYEYAYFAAPRSGQSLFMSLHFCAIGLSFMFSTMYINVFPRPNVNIDFICCQKNEQWYWSFYTYFFNIAGLQLIFMVLFFVCQKKFGIVKLNPQHLESHRFRR